MHCLIGVQVPDEIVALLNDDGSQELTTKEIMRRWENSGKVPQATTTSPTAHNSPGARSREGQRNNPHITQADNSGPLGWQNEASVRHVGGSGGVHGHGYGPSGGQPSPPRNKANGHELNAPYMPYAQHSAAGSTESAHRTGSPRRHSFRSPAFKQEQLGTAGAG